MRNEEIITKIQNQINKCMIELDENLMLWLKEHMILPHPITVNISETITETFWLITDYTGKNDSSYRIVYDSNDNIFGLVMRTISGSDYFLGFYGDLKETVLNM